MPTVDEVLEVGIDRAIKARIIGEKCGLTVRGVTLEVRGLIKDGVPVASSTDGYNGGYYITSTRAEAEAYITFMRSHIIELAKRMRDYKVAARPILRPGQLPLM